MNNLHGVVLELFNKEDKNKISNIIYGKKALEKYAKVSIKNKKEREKYMKKWNLSKLKNSVYFTYYKRGVKGHRFISNSWKEGGTSYLGHLEKKKKKKSKKIQHGGMPCIPCMAAVSPMLGLGKLGLGAAAMGTGYYVSQKMSSNSISNVNGKKKIKRKDVYEMNKNGKKKKMTFIQDGLNVTIKGKKSKSKTLKAASKKYNDAINKCIKNGFKKC
tara:strand:- start:1692 stop:2339 length:648 start_codon:yes stop_codon:yes gene_type:complete